MSAPSRVAGALRSPRLRRALPVIAVLALLAAVALVTATEEDSGQPLDPRSAGGSGTRALVEVLDALGAQVDIAADAPDAAAQTTLLLSDDLDEGRRADLRAWVEAGGTLVVTDPRSTFAPPPVGQTAIGLLEATVPRGCDLPALADVARVAAPSSITYDLAPDASGCFQRGEGYWFVATASGRGTIVALGGPAFLTNALLGEADNAVLAAALLAPQPGTQVRVLTPALAGGGDETLGDLVPERVSLALLQLLIAFGVVVVWRARRLGRPVLEDNAVQVPGSELVVAVGNLWQQTRRRQRAAAVLRRDLRRDLCARLGLPATAPADAIAEAAAARTGADVATVLSALQGPDPDSEAAVVDLARQVAEVRRAALAPASRKPFRERSRV